MLEPTPAARTKRELVRERLLSLHGGLTPGMAVPPERELAASLGVSRPTLRSAVDELVHHGYLERRQGSGTYVSRPRLTKALTLTSFSEDMHSRGIRPGGGTSSFRAELAGAELAARLHVSPTARIWAIHRLRTADDEPIALGWACVPQHLLSELSPDDLDLRPVAVLRHGEWVTTDGTHDDDEPELP